jgi:hypothetical protein
VLEAHSNTTGLATGPVTGLCTCAARRSGGSWRRRRRERDAALLESAEYERTNRSMEEE